MRPRAAFVLLLAFAAGFAGARPDPRKWLPLARDGLHDPANRGTRQLQQPRDALSPLAPDSAGNQVRWVDALERGQITPRSAIDPGSQVRVLNDEFLLNLRGSAPIVRFPHRAHTLWLDCSNCHEELFKSKAGANRYDMKKILQGEQCGVCHGAVAFPLTECSRCHSVSRAKVGAGHVPLQSGGIAAPKGEKR